MDLLVLFQGQVPKLILHNRRTFERIFTCLQTHPCYLINWLTKLHLDAQAIRYLLRTVFGPAEMLNDQRSILSLMQIAS
jgi:hypothetical protein